MPSQEPDIVHKLKWSLPWLLRYPLWRARTLVASGDGSKDPTHIVFLIANHFEPGVGVQAAAQVKRWYRLARQTGTLIRDHDGTPFRHTYFFPAEQYDSACIEMLSGLQAE